MTFSVNRPPQPLASLPSSPSPMVSQNSLPVLRPFSSRPPWSSRPRRYGGGAFGCFVPARPTPPPPTLFFSLLPCFCSGQAPLCPPPLPLPSPARGGLLSA